jgi:hypothetical protein
MTAQQFIEHNIASEPYSTARFYVEGFYPFVKCKPLPESLLLTAEKDLQIFAEREQSRLALNKPLVGDAIIRKDGKKSYIGIFTYDGKFQDTFGGSFYLGGCYASYSGGFTMDVLNVKRLQLTEELTPLRCWIFSENSVGGGRGVHYQINVKTWREI